MRKSSIAILFVALLIGVFVVSGCGSTSDTKTDTTTDINSDINTTLYVESYLDSNFTADDWRDETHSKNVDANFSEVFVDTEVKRLDIVLTADRWQSMLDDMSATYGAFGSATSTQHTTPQQVQTPQETITGQTTTLVDSDEDPIFVPADIYYKGVEWYRVGIRFKGNSSLQSAWESGILKLAFKLDFDEFEDEYTEIKNQRFYGFKKFSLKNNYDDSSFLREKVAADVFSDAGVVVSHTAFYTLYIDHGNGPEYFGLYTLVEEVDGTVLDTQFSDDGGNLYKPEDGSANFVYGTFAQDDFTKKTNEDDENWSDITTLFNALHDDTSDATTFRANLEAAFDVDAFLKYLAVNQVIQNWDTYGKMAHNYYLYNNADRNADGNSNTLTWIPWDNNEALQIGKLGGALALDFSDMDTTWPLIENIYADSTYKAKYERYLQEIVDTNGAFEVTKMQEKYETYANLIKEYVTIEREGFTFFDTNDYETEFTNAIEELKSHASERKAAVISYIAK